MTIYKFKTLYFLFAIIFGASSPAFVQSSETDTSNVAEKAAPKPSFLQRWKRIKTVLEKKAYEIQQTRHTAGVRAREATDDITDGLYQPGQNTPHLLEIKDAIAQLQQYIKADSTSTDVPELLFLTAQCYEKLKDPKKANAIYTQLIEKHPKTEFAKLAKAQKMSSTK